MNFWSIELDRLPSKGRYYSRKGRIGIRPLTVGNLKYLATANPSTVTGMLNNVLEDCLKLENIKFDELYKADRDFLLFWIRTNSFVSSNGYNIDIKCPHCNRPISQFMKLDNLSITDIDDTTYQTWESPTGLLIHPFSPKVNDFLYELEDKSLETILNYTNVRELCPKDTNLTWWVMHQDAEFYARALAIANAGKFGVNSLTELHCNHCGNPVYINIDLSDSNIFTNISLPEILKIQIQVSKYCGFQISDDTSYTEVEIMLEVIKDMIQKEEQEMEKQKANMSRFHRH